MAEIHREFTATSNSLRARGCHVCGDWLKECINFFRSENNQYSPKELDSFVFDQWLLADLRDIAGDGSFPPNLCGTMKATLEGKMACQVEFVTDIGHSSYSQIQRVRNEDVGNLNVDEVGKEFLQAWEPRSNRMLQLILSDGIQTLKGIEYRPIPFLKADIIPGTKILVQGPVLCRRGILMLEERHVTVLGGEVDALVISNAYENVLARRLNLPENPDPYNMTAVQNQLPAVQENNPHTQPSNTIQPTVQPQLCQPVIQQPELHQRRLQQPEPKNPVANKSGRHNNSTFSTNRKMVQPPLSWSSSAQQSVMSCGKNTLQQTQPLEFCGSDEDFLNIPLNEVEWETNTDPRHPSSVAKKCLPTEVNSDYDMGSDEEAILLQAEASLALSTDSAIGGSTVLTSTVSQKSSNRSPTENITSKRSASSALPEESLKKPLFAKRRKETSSQEVSSTSDLNFLIEDDFLEMKETEENVSNVPISLSVHPFVYLSQIMQVTSTIPKVFRVKAAVITVIEKLSISENGWKLSAKISDGSLNVDVRFSPKVLDELIGMSAETMTALKKQMVQQPDKKEVVRKILETAQRRLINLNCLLDIQLCDNQELPLIVGLNGLSVETASALKNRQDSV